MRHELLLYDVIGADWFGEGMTGKRFAEELEALNLRSGDQLTLRVNSPGGDVFDGLAIYNQLAKLGREQGVRVVAQVEGLAASAASFIIQAAADIQVAKAAFVMVHRAWGLTIGNTEDHLETAELLEKNDGVLASIYADRSKRPAAEMLELMSAETWLTGEEAVEAKLADRLIVEAASAAAEEEVEERAAAAYAKRSRHPFQRVPERLAARVAALHRPAPTTPQAKGAVLNGENKTRLNDARGLIQDVLDSAEPKDAAGDEQALAELRGDLALVRARLTGQQAEIDSLRAQAGLRKER